MMKDQWIRNEVNHMIESAKENCCDPDKIEKCVRTAFSLYNIMNRNDIQSTDYDYICDMLKRMSQELPLTAIKDHPSEWIEDGNGELRAIRYPSLTRHKDNDKEVFSDSRRVLCVDLIQNLKWRDDVVCGIADELIPIKLPYYPEEDRIRVYAETHKRNGKELLAVYTAVWRESTMRIDRFFERKKGDMTWAEIGGSKYYNYLYEK